MRSTRVRTRRNRVMKVRDHERDRQAWPGVPRHLRWALQARPLEEIRQERVIQDPVGHAEGGNPGMHGRGNSSQERMVFACQFCLAELPAVIGGQKFIMASRECSLALGGGKEDPKGSRTGGTGAGVGWDARSRVPSGVQGRRIQAPARAQGALFGMTLRDGGEIQWQ